MSKKLMSLISLLAVLVAFPSEARQVIDQAGRTVTIPDHIQRVYASSPPLVVLLNAVAPERLIGLNFPFEEQGKRYVTPQVAALPVIGGVFGTGSSMNQESIMKLKPDVVLAWKSELTERSRLDETFKRMGIPVLYVRLDTLADWPAALEFVAQALGQKKRGDAQAAYVRRALREVALAVGSVPEQDKPRVYYAEGADGLATDCHKSFHTEAIELAGGYNVYRCEPRDHMGQEAISIEQVLAFNPQVIVAQDRNFVLKVRQDPRWQSIRAVREGRVYAIPRWPYNWFDRPPSGMKALGIQWFAGLLYPERFKKDIRRETQHFYKLFFGQEPTAKDLDALLLPP